MTHQTPTEQSKKNVREHRFLSETHGTYSEIDPILQHKIVPFFLV